MATHAVQHQAVYHQQIGWIGRYIFSTDHKMIAKQYLLTGLSFAITVSYTHLTLPTTPYV